MKVWSKDNENGASRKIATMLKNLEAPMRTDDKSEWLDPGHRATLGKKTMSGHTRRASGTLVPVFTPNALAS